jgi:Amt family ammonium transporter
MTSATIVSGAVAERLQLGGYCIFCTVMTTVVYPIVVAWTWSGTGWLNKIGAGYMDFAGSGIVHLTGGTGALVGAAIVGPRHGRYERPEEFAPHNVAFVVLGTVILWFSWYGFNCGSTLGMNAEKAQLAAQVAVNTTLSPAFAGLTSTLVQRYRSGKWSTVATCGGLLGGLVSITAPCGNVNAWSAVVIGIVGGLVYLGSAALLPKLKLDDPVEAIPVHGACGIWGVLATAIFDFGNFMPGPVHAWNGFSPYEKGGFGDLMLAQVVGVIAIVAWTGAWLTMVFYGLKMAGLLRITAHQEEMGLDADEFEVKEAYSPRAVKSPSPFTETKKVSNGCVRDETHAASPFAVGEDV